MYDSPMTSVRFDVRVASDLSDMAVSETSDLPIGNRTDGLNRTR